MNASFELSALVPALDFTTTSTVEADVPLDGGETACKRIGLTNVVGTCVVPKKTTASLVKLVPLICTAVPPAMGPAFGSTELTMGVEYEKMSPAVAGLATPPTVTVTGTAPAPAGDVVVICVGETTVTNGAAVVPKVTDAPAAKPEPVIVTDVPPPGGPEFGETEAITGPEE